MRSADHANESNATFILVEFNLSRLEPEILNRTLPNDLEPGSIVILIDDWFRIVRSR